MAAYLKFPSQGEWEGFLACVEGGGCIIVPPCAADDIAKSLGIAVDELYDLDGKLMEYDFGGEADLLIDIAGGPDDFAFRALNKKLLGEMK